MVVILTNLHNLKKLNKAATINVLQRYVSLKTRENYCKIIEVRFEFDLPVLEYEPHNETRVLINIDWCLKEKNRSEL